MPTATELCDATRRYSLNTKALISVIAVAILLQTALFSFSSTTIAAKALYSCKYHCYGLVDWSKNQYPSIDGGQTVISMVELSCSPSACGNANPPWFIDNEMWLYGNGGQNYWVEDGYSTYSNGHSTRIDYFWADSRPNGGGYTEHDLATVPSGDFGHNSTFQIYGLCCSEYQVEIYSPSNIYNGTSTANSMSPTDVVIGQELFGTSGASAPTANFVDNEYINTSGGGVYFTTAPNPQQSSPVHAVWAVKPASGNSGGKLQTYCC